MQKNTLKNKLTKGSFTLLTVMFMLGMISWTSLGAATQVDDEMIQHSESDEYAEPFVENSYEMLADIFPPNEVDDTIDPDDISVETISLYVLV